MLKKILLIFLASLFAFAGFKAYVAFNAYAANKAAEVVKIKEVIKEAFITEGLAHATTVEYSGKTFQGEPPIDAFAELEIYINNKKGYLDRLKRFMFMYLQDGNERPYRHPLKKKNFKEFDFKWIAINGDVATVRADIYFETTFTSGHEVTMPGGDKHLITLERINSRWQIVWDDWEPLPEYRP